MGLIPYKKRYVIFGAGNAGRLVAQQPLPFCYFVDNDAGKHPGSLMGLEIKPPSALMQESKGEVFIVIANFAHSQAIAAQLAGMGFAPGEDFADFRACGLYEAMPVIDKLRINVTRKCNSRCLMCNVWQDKCTKELAPEEMAEMLGDPFFRHVKEAYITGGEPTALSDFSAYVKAAMNALPSLRSVSTVVNGLLPEKTIAVMQKCRGLLSGAGVGFYVSVSLDGLERENDAQRGVPGSFAKVMKTIYGLREAGFFITVSTTITKINLHGMDRFLDFLQAEQLPGNFKLGIQAAFFDNKDSGSIFAYTDDELYLLKRFFLRVAEVYKDNLFARTVALNQFHMLEGSERLLSCPYLECTAATLTEMGELKYCCSKSKALGLLKDAPAAVLFQNNREYLSFLGQTNCLTCNADAFSGQSEKFKVLLDEQAYWEAFYFSSEWLQWMVDETLVGDVYHYGGNTLLLTGFFGSETEADIGLIQSVIHSCEKNYPGLDISVASSLPFVTRHMLKLAAPDKKIDVLPVHDKRYLSACFFAPSILAVTPKEPYYPWVKCAEHIAGKNGKAVAFFSLAEAGPAEGEAKL